MTKVYFYYKEDLLMLKRAFIVVLLLFTMVACDNATTTNTEVPTTSITYHDITLENEYNDLTREFEEVAYGETLILPVDQIEGKVFVGWSDGEKVYNNSLIVETSLTLSAVYENVSDVFTYYSNPDSDQIAIKSYTGNSKYLRIPEVIDGFFVKVIAAEAFVSTDIVEVELPKSLTRIYTNAFMDMPNLERVSFYGNYSGTREGVIASQEYDNIIQEFSDVCQITETTETGWKFAEGCPIKEVLAVNETVFIPGQGEFYSYRVLFDLAVYDNDPNSLTIEPEAFNNLPKLTTFEFPERFNFFYPDIFINTPNLINLDFTDSNMFYTQNKIVYKRISSNFNPEDIEYQLVFYPPGLTDKEFTVPDQVTSIGSVAFNGNNHLEVINLSENVKMTNSRAFTYVYNLREINVDEENEYLYSIDGVLYSGNFLLCYPRAKTDQLYIMPDNIILIAPVAFLGQKYLVDIAFNDGLIRIGYEAFTETEKIRILNIPSSVVYIDSLYYKESSLEIVIINRSVVIDGDITNISYPRSDDFPLFFVPDDSFEDYLANQVWSIMQNNVYRHSELEE
jgi:hypothetical protein